MIITTKVKVTVSGKNKPHYENKGYKLPLTKDKRGRYGVKKGTQIYVDVFDLPPQSQTKIKYKCDECGAINEVHAYTIFSRSNSQYNKDGRTFCSNCANRRMSGKNSGAYKHGSKRYPEYRYNAKKRGINFELTVEQFKEIIKQKCHYCGGYSKDRNVKSRGNGIDRKDSNEGYIYENCVTCCATCNFVKNKMGYRDFIKYIRDIYNNTKDYEV